jgi:hypothetical protein
MVFLCLKKTDRQMRSLPMFRMDYATDAEPVWVYVPMARCNKMRTAFPHNTTAALNAVFALKFVLEKMSISFPFVPGCLRSTNLPTLLLALSGKHV